MEVERLEYDQRMQRIRQENARAAAANVAAVLAAQRRQQQVENMTGHVEPYKSPYFVREPAQSGIMASNE